MNIAVAGAGTPSPTSAGPMITQLMMNDAVTGTASPSSEIATAASTTVITSTAVSLLVIARAAVTSRLASSWPRPVLVIVETTMPAAVHTAATGSTDRTPAASDSYSVTP